MAVAEGGGPEDTGGEEEVGAVGDGDPRAERAEALTVAGRVQMRS